jgi:hypothetical protein
MYSPFFYPFTNTNEMRIKDFIEDMKAYDEWKSSQKPKEENKDTKDKWGPLDYMTFVLFINAVAVPVGGVFILNAATNFMKAIPH